MATIEIFIFFRTRIQTWITLFLSFLIIATSCSYNINGSSSGVTKSLPTENQFMVDPTEKIILTGDLKMTQPPVLSTSTVVIDKNVGDNIEAHVTSTGENVENIQFHLCSPLASEEIDQLWEIVSDPYKPPPPNREERHHGVDFSYYRRGGRTGIEGEIIQAILPGIVRSKVNNRLPYGNMVIIETQANILPVALREILSMDENKSLYTLYAHMKEEPQIKLGEEVDCGQYIGNVGLTGYNVVNPHLHLETRIGIGGIEFESMAFYDTSALINEMENYRRWRTSGDFVHFDPMLLFQFFLDFEEE